MSERFERLVTFGVAPVNYNIPETWTDEVKALYKRLESGDFDALAPLIECDLEFITDRWSMWALAVLKYDPNMQDQKARASLRKIANVIARRPGRPRGPLPWGDRLEAELKSLTALIEQHGLLQVKDDSQAIRARIEVAMPKAPKEGIAKLAAALGRVSKMTLGHIRRPRSWALQTVAAHYGVEPKQVEKRISREIRSGRRRR